MLAALLYGVSWMVDPITLLTAPFLLPQLGLAGLGSLGRWGGYLWWSQRWEFGRHQSRFLVRFLLHQLFITRKTSPHNSPPRPPKQTSWLFRVWRLGRRRWNNIGRHTLKALPL